MADHVLEIQNVALSIDSIFDKGRIESNKEMFIIPPRKDNKKYTVEEKDGNIITFKSFGELQNYILKMKEEEANG